MWNKRTPLRQNKLTSQWNSNMIYPMETNWPGKDYFDGP